MSNKFVVQMNLAGSNVPFTKIQNALPSDPAGNSAVWEDEHSENRGTDENGTEFIHAHVPYHAEADAKAKFDELAALTGVVSSANAGSYLHYHECPGGATEQAWDCGNNIISEKKA